MSEKWTRLDDLPSSRYHESVMMKDSLYIFGFHIDRFDLNTRTFSTVHLLDEDRSNFGVCHYDENNLMFVGGLVTYRVLTNTCYLYDVTTNSFKQIGGLII